MSLWRLYRTIGVPFQHLANGVFEKSNGLLGRVNP